MMLDYTKYLDHKIKMAGSQVMKEYWWLLVVLAVMAVVIILLGWAWVYLLNWGNCDNFLKLTTPVNNSVWELSKVIIYPMLIVFIVVYAAAHHALRNPAVALLTGTATAVLLAAFLFYLSCWWNVERANFGATIAIWVLSIFVAMIPVFICFVAPYFGDGANYACIAIYLLIIVLYSIFTYVPPGNGGPFYHSTVPACIGGEMANGNYPNLLGGGSPGGDNRGNGGNGGGQAQKDKVKKMKKEAMKKKEECGYNSDGHDGRKKKNRKNHDGYDSSSS